MAQPATAPLLLPEHSTAPEEPARAKAAPHADEGAAAERPAGESHEEKAEAEGGDEHEKPKKKLTPAQKRWRAIALVAGVLVLLVGGGIWWWRSSLYEETDDAQIDGYISAVAPRVAGTVMRVNVDDNQSVGVGQPLVELDRSDFDVGLAKAKAALAQADAQLRTDEPEVSITETSNKTLTATTSSDVASEQAGIAEAQRDLAQATAAADEAMAKSALEQVEAQRGEVMLKGGAISRSEYDQRVSSAAGAEAHLVALREAAEAARRRIQEQVAKANAAASRAQEAKSNAPRELEAKRATVDFRQASRAAALAEVRQAELDLTYASILAPTAGIVGRRSVNVGDRVTVGQQLLAVTQIEKLWVTANFRETQVRRMQPGQHVTVHVDALGEDFGGQVESLGAATGSRYSVLPPENATGNYVKVVQRLPVRISLDPGQAGLDRLRPGMSVEPEVRVR